MLLPLATLFGFEVRPTKHAYNREELMPTCDAGLGCTGQRSQGFLCKVPGPQSGPFSVRP